MAGKVDSGLVQTEIVPPMDPRLRHFRGIASRVPGYVVGCGRIEDTNKARPTPLIAESALVALLFRRQP